jgi:hypothetical protein
MATAQPARYDGGVVKWDDSVCENLNGMAAFAGDEHTIAASGLREHRFNRRTTVSLDQDPTWLVESTQEVAENLAGVFSPWVAERQNNPVSPHFSNGGKPAPRGTVTTSFIAQNAMNAAGCDESEGGQRCLESPWGLHCVDPHCKILTLEYLRGVACKRLADSCVGSTCVGDDDLKSSSLWADAFHYYASRAALERFVYKAVPVVPGSRLRNRNEQLPGIEPAMIVAATRNFPVRASHEMGPGEQSPQAHRGNAPLRQTVNEPARHRLTPPCLDFSRLRLNAGPGQSGSTQPSRSLPRPVPGVAF